MEEIKDMSKEQLLKIIKYKDEEIKELKQEIEIFIQLVNELKK